MKKEANLSQILDYVKSLIPVMKIVGVQQAKKYTVPALGLGLGALMAGKIKKNNLEKHEDRIHENLFGSYKAIVTHGNIDAPEHLIRTRFEEIAQHSPTVASTPTVASKIIKRILNTGLTDQDLKTLYAIEHNQHGVKHLSGLSLADSTSEKFIKDVLAPGLATVSGQLAWTAMGDPLRPSDMGELSGASTEPKSLQSLNMKQSLSEGENKEMIKEILSVPEGHGKNLHKIMQDRLDKAQKSGNYDAGFDPRDIFPRAVAAQADGKAVPSFFVDAHTNKNFGPELERLDHLARTDMYHPEAVEYVLGVRTLYPDHPDVLNDYPLIQKYSPSVEKKGHVMNQTPDLELATRILADQYCLIKTATLVDDKKIKGIAQRSARNVAKRNNMHQSNFLKKLLTAAKSESKKSMEYNSKFLKDIKKTVRGAKPQNMSPSLGGVLKGLMGAAAIGLGVGGAHQVGSYFQTRKMNDKIKDSWEETSGTLRRLSDESSRVVSGVDYSDPETQTKARGAFQTLADVAPVLASNPMLATTFVNTVMQNEGQVGIDTAKTISEIQKNLKAVSEYESPFAGSPAIQGFESGFGMAGGKDFVKNIADAVGQGAEV
jgi:hypothetical protein